MMMKQWLHLEMKMEQQLEEDNAMEYFYAEFVTDEKKEKLFNFLYNLLHDDIKTHVRKII